MRISFELSNPTECSEVMALIQSYHQGGGPVEPVPTPEPEPVPEPTPVPIPEPTPEPVPPPTEEPPFIETQQPEPIHAQDDTPITRDDLQNLIRSYLVQFKGEDEAMAGAKKGLIDVLLNVAGVGSSATVPEDKLADTFDAVKAHIEAA